MNRPKKPTIPSEVSAACCGADHSQEPASLAVPAGDLQELVLSIAGMHCEACAGHLREALLKVEGVASAEVVFGDAMARIRYDAAKTDIGDILAAIASTGYAAGKRAAENRAAEPPKPASASKTRPVLIGAAAALVVIGFYLGLITLTSDWAYAKAQFGEYRGWILSLAAGLGLQVGLFGHLRAVIARMRTKGATSSVAASGGVTTLGMALCCSHYVAAFLPSIGLPFLSTAVAGLAAYQVPFFILGVVSNLFGIGYMLRLMAKNGIAFSSWTPKPA